MNKARHTAIRKLLGELENIKSQLETIRDEEQEYFDGLSENAQEGEKGEVSTAAIDGLEEALGTIETAIDSLGDAAPAE